MSADTSTTVYADLMADCARLMPRVPNWLSFYHRGYVDGAAVAFGLIGMAEAIRRNYYVCDDCGRFSGVHLRACPASDLQASKWWP